VPGRRRSPGAASAAPDPAGNDAAASIRPTERPSGIDSSPLRAVRWLRAYVGDAEPAIALVERAMRLSPVDPAMFYFTTAIGLAHFVAGRYADAAERATRAIHDRPTYLAAHRLLVTSLAQLGRLDAAAQALRALRAVAPDYTVASPPAQRPAAPGRPRALPRRAAAGRAAGLTAATEPGRRALAPPAQVPGRGASAVPDRAARRC
jgi:tetratricopeptide (TPR) repeat protein